VSFGIEIGCPVDASIMLGWLIVCGGTSVGVAVGIGVDVAVGIGVGVATEAVVVSAEVVVAAAEVVAAAAALVVDVSSDAVSVLLSSGDAAGIVSTVFVCDESGSIFIVRSGASTKNPRRSAATAAETIAMIGITDFFFGVCV
jgi:hypothetical protein